MCVQVSGREVFEFRPELVDDDDAEADDTQYDENDDDEEEEEEETVNMKLSTFRQIHVCVVVSCQCVWKPSPYIRGGMGVRWCPLHG